MKTPPTRVQRRILDFIEASIDAEGVAPTQAEIRAHFGWSSFGTVARHLGRLERGGHIHRAENRTRGITLVDEVESRLFVAEDLPDARELLERIVRRLPEVLSLPASGTRMRSAMWLFGLGSTHTARLLRALGHDPAQRVGCLQWERDDGDAGDAHPKTDRWTVGVATAPRPTDEDFGSRAEAEARALEYAGDEVVAVWAPQDEGSDLVSLVFSRRVYDSGT